MSVQEKKPLKQKLLTYYEQIFKVDCTQKSKIVLGRIKFHTFLFLVGAMRLIPRIIVQGTDPSCKRPDFWDEFFLLRVRR